MQGGLPQCSCLSPLVSNRYTVYLHQLQGCKTHIFQYADDFLLVSVGVFFDDAVKSLFLKESLFFKECAKLNLCLNPRKTNAIYFAKISSKTINLFINGIKVHQCRFFRVLGISINARLTFRTRYKDAVINCQSYSNVLKLLTNKHAGLLKP